MGESQWMPISGPRLAAAFLRLNGRGTQGQRRLLRAALRERDGDNCCICGGAMDFTFAEGSQWSPNFPTIEHHIPLCQGGSSKLGNLGLAHLRCNRAKAQLDRVPPSTGDR